MSPRLLAFAYFVGVEALCLLLLPGDWRGLAVLPVMGYWAAWCVLGPGHGAHSDRAGLNLDAPNVPYPTGMALEDDLAAWLAELEQRGYIGGWESGGCDPGPKAEVWPSHDAPWPPVPETSPDGGGLVLLDSPGEAAGAAEPTPAALAPPPPPDVLQFMQRQDAGALLHIDRLAMELAAERRRCVADIRERM